MHDTPPPSVPDFTQWPSFPFEGDLRVKQLDEPVAVEPPRKGEGLRECIACNAPDDAYIWVGERWRVRAMDRPTGLPMVLILESRSHLDLGDLPNLLAAELGVMTVRLERAIRSLDGVARVHVNRWGDGSAHLHMWFLARPYGRLQLRGTFLSLWDSILPPISESQWRENLAHVAAWLAEFGGRPLAEPPRIQWQTPSSIAAQSSAEAAAAAAEEAVSVIESEEETPLPLPVTENEAGPDLPTPPGVPADAAAEDTATGKATAETPSSRTPGDDGTPGDGLDPETDRDADGQPAGAAAHPESPAGNPGTDPATSGPDDDAAGTTATDDPAGTGQDSGDTVTPDTVRR
ncbi:hypothetical protein [Micromonospora sp. S-DT3-3-22]|uniref:hypothetical protein n=1 Tax=Micromonospora sp. S-DT3-3-22 TaxID=2755359 RepID=UPI002814B192|nr:hypothetical protein [Micromonospora sp. S-DT3-3-22]